MGVKAGETVSCCFSHTADLLFVLVPREVCLCTHPQHQNCLLIYCLYAACTRHRHALYLDNVQLSKAAGKISQEFLRIDLDPGHQSFARPRHAPGVGDVSCASSRPVCCMLQTQCQEIGALVTICT